MKKLILLGAASLALQIYTLPAYSADDDYHNMTEEEILLAEEEYYNEPEPSESETNETVAPKPEVVQPDDTEEPEDNSSTANTSGSGSGSPSTPTTTPTTPTTTTPTETTGNSGNSGSANSGSNGSSGSSGSSTTNSGTETAGSTTPSTSTGSTGTTTPTTTTPTTTTPTTGNTGSTTDSGTNSTNNGTNNTTTTSPETTKPTTTETETETDSKTDEETKDDPVNGTGGESVSIPLSDDKGSTYKVTLLAHQDNTWTYKVEGLAGRDLSHWTLGIESCIGHFDAYTSGAEVGIDASIKAREFTGIKWNTEGGIFSFTLDADYPANTMQVLVKAGTNYAISTITAPDCSQKPIQCKTSKIYAVNDRGLNDSEIISIDPNDNFTVQQLGKRLDNYDIEALDAHPFTHELYGGAGDDTNRPGHLYHIDKSTGIATDLGATGVREIDSLSFHPNGTLWGWAQDQGLFIIENPSVSVKAKVVLPSDGEIEVEEISWNTKGTILYGVESLQIPSSGTTEQEKDGGVRIWAYDVTTNKISPLCHELMLSINEIEALEVLPDETLMFGFDGQSRLVIGGIDPDICSIVAQQYITTTYDDIEGITWVGCDDDNTTTTKTNSNTVVESGSTLESTDATETEEEVVEETEETDTTKTNNGNSQSDKTTGSDKTATTTETTVTTEKTEETDTTKTNNGNSQSDKTAGSDKTVTTTETTVTTEKTEATDTTKTNNGNSQSDKTTGSDKTATTTETKTSDSTSTTGTSSNTSGSSSSTTSSSSSSSSSSTESTSGTTSSSSSSSNTSNSSSSSSDSKNAASSSNSNSSSKNK